eukprot:tig00001181_g7419.t1
MRRKWKADAAGPWSAPFSFTQRLDDATAYTVEVPAASAFRPFALDVERLGPTNFNKYFPKTYMAIQGRSTRRPNMGIATDEYKCTGVNEFTGSCWSYEMTKKATLPKLAEYDPNMFPSPSEPYRPLAFHSSGWAAIAGVIYRTDANARPGPRSLLQ